MKEKKNDKNRMIFLIVSIIIIIVVTIVIIISMNKKSTYNANTSAKEINNELINVEVNKDAKPEEMPSIGGTENVKIDDGIKTNVSQNISKERKFLDYTFKNIKLQATLSGTVFTATVFSNSQTKTQGKDIKIKFFDKNGEFVSMMNAYIGQIKPGESIEFRCESTSDLSNAYDLEILE